MGTLTETLFVLCPVSNSVKECYIQHQGTIAIPWGCDDAHGSDKCATCKSKLYDSFRNHPDSLIENNASNPLRFE